MTATFPITITLNQVRDHSPCKDGWEMLLKHLGKTKADDEPLPLETVLDSNGLGDAMWCLCVLPSQCDSAMRLFAVKRARDVQHLMTDKRSLKALDIAEAFARGEASDDDLAAARAAAWAAELVGAGASRYAARAAAGAAEEAAWGAAWDAAAAAGDVVWEATREAQSNHFRAMCRGEL